MPSSNPTVFNAGRVKEFLTVDSAASAPSSTTSRLYNLNGVLYFDGVNLESGGGGGVGDLNQAYENGATITVDTGAIILNDGQTTANTLTATKTGTGSGDIFSLKFENAGTGRGIYIDMDDGIAANAMLIDSGGTARTGADITFTDDSTATHILIDANSSGAGKSTALDWTDSYAGSNASIGVLLTMGNSNGLSSEGIQIVRGTGVRTGSAINIDEGSTGSANVIDIDVTAAYTGDIFSVVTSAAATGNIFLVDLTSAVAATAIRLISNGTRTQPLFEVADTQDGSKSLFEVVQAGATWSGHVFEVSLDAASTGDVMNVDMNAAVGGRAIYLDSGAATRTAALIDILANGDGNSDVFNLDYSNTGAAALFDINSSGAGTGLLFDIDVSAASSGNIFDVAIGAVLYTGDVISIDLGATATGSQALVITSGIMTRTTNLINIDENGAASGNTIDVDIGAVTYTGDVLSINMGATATGGQALVVVSGAMARTVPLVSLTDTGTNSGGDIFEIVRDGVHTAPVFDIDDSSTASGAIFDYASAAAATGTVFNVNMTNAVGAIVHNYTLAGIRTADFMNVNDSSTGADIFMDLNFSGAGSGIYFDIDISGASSGNLWDVLVGAVAYTGNLLNLDLGATATGSQAAVIASGAMARSTDLIEITDAGTSSGDTLSVVYSGLVTGNVFDIHIDAAATTGYVLNIDLNAGVAYGGILLDAGNAVRTVDIIDATFDGSGNVSFLDINDSNTGTANLIDIDSSGVGSGNILDITYSAADTGNAIDLNMSSNVAGMAISINSAGTGVDGEGSALDIIHSGVLVAGADVLRINSSGNCSSTSNAASITMSGAGTAGTNALHIDASGTNVEAIEIEAGILFEATVTANGAGNGETISSAANVSFYDPNGASRTGVILAAGLRDGQRVHVVNIADAAEDCTFAAAGTSNVAGGSACVVSQFECRTFIWNATRSLWYYEIAT